MNMDMLDMSVSSGRSRRTDFLPPRVSIFHCDGETIEAEDAVVYGNNNVVKGKNSTVIGDLNTVSGESSRVTGSGNVVTGANATVNGDKNTIYGDNAVVNGANNYICGRNPTVNGEDNIDAWEEVLPVPDVEEQQQQQQQTQSGGRRAVAAKQWTAPKAQPNWIQDVVRSSIQGNTQRVRAQSTRARAQTKRAQAQTKRAQAQIKRGCVRKVVTRRVTSASPGTIVSTDGGNVFINGLEISGMGVGDGPPSFSTSTGESLYHQIFGGARASASASAGKESLHDALTSLKERDRALDDDAEERVQCTICFANYKCVAFTPCGHAETCVECALKMVKGVGLECPICKEDVDKVAFVRM